MTEQSQIRCAIERAVAYLESAQLASGELPIEISLTPDMNGECIREPCVFPTALAARTLSITAAADRVRTRALDFLEHEMHPDGLWRHPSSDKPCITTPHSMSTTRRSPQLRWPSLVDTFTLVARWKKRVDGTNIYDGKAFHEIGEQLHLREFPKFRQDFHSLLTRRERLMLWRRELTYRLRVRLHLSTKNELAAKLRIPAFLARLHTRQS